MHFCVTGTGRCGTTLLRNILNLHPDLFVFNETHWIPKMFEFFGQREAAVDVLIDIIHRTHHVRGVPVTELDESHLRIELSGRTSLTVMEFGDAVGRSFARRHGKRLWADKTPDYGPYLSLLQLLWPQCRVVHVIRHGFDVAASMKAHPGFQWMASAREMWWCPVSFNGYYRAITAEERPLVDFLDLWYWRLLRIRDEATRLRPGSYLEVRFEDLISEPEAALRTIAGFVRVTASRDWLTAGLDVIDVDRFHDRVVQTAPDETKPRHLNLLEDLGYDPRIAG